MEAGVSSPPSTSRLASAPLDCNPATLLVPQLCPRTGAQWGPKAGEQACSGEWAVALAH